MAAFTTVMSAVADVDDSIILEYDKQFMLSLAAQGVMDQFATVKRDINSKSIIIPKYDALALATTPLAEEDDVTSEAMVDSNVTLTPVEYGNVVTPTLLASLQTAKMSDLAASRLTGINAGRTLNKLATLACDASANILRVNDRAADANIVAGDIISASEIAQAYNKLDRASALPMIGSEYVLVMHSDVIHDLREATGAGSWQDVNKYTRPEGILKNEVGMFKGFIVVSDAMCKIDLDAGDGNVDVYYSYALGFNSFGKAVSQDVSQRITGPFDKLSRFVNFGWLAVLQYKIVEQEALWCVRSSSSLGTNT